LNVNYKQYDIHLNERDANSLIHQKIQSTYKGTLNPYHLKCMYFEFDKKNDMASYMSLSYQTMENVHFKVAQHNFLCTISASFEANQHGNMSCLNGNSMLVLTDRKLRVTKHKPQNLNFNTYHLPKHIKFQGVAQHTFQCLNNPNPQNISPSKHVTFWELCFGPMCPSSMFPHAIPIHAP
jgi:hypothetical protein